MKLGAAGEPHLTYCTNIHAGETWPEVKSVVENQVTAVKRAVAPGIPFGVGLRLSARAATELAKAGELAAFRGMLHDQGLYVFTINGFPFGAFHGTRVKEAVYLPDWLDDARLSYTAVLGELLAALLPDDVTTGSVSTVPGAFRARVSCGADAESMADRILRASAVFDDILARTGKTITLALEPEPFCHFETVSETITFFKEYLLSTRAIDRYATLTGMNASEAEASVRRHVGVCFDACHMAVEFEEPSEALARFFAAGIGIGKVQISSGLEVKFAKPEELEPLRAFADDVYLHQVVESGATRLRRYLDLPEALEKVDHAEAERTWRVHFHVPVFRQSFGPFAGTQPYLRDVLKLLRNSPVSPHLEVETYTWGVLPEEHRREDVTSAVVRELEWVRGELVP
jgi:sugar phosphate isomerase/epimerase